MTPGIRAGYAAYLPGPSGDAPLPVSPGNAAAGIPGGTAGEGMAAVPETAMPADPDPVLAALGEQLAAVRQNTLMESMMTGLVAGILFILCLWLGGRRQ